MYQSEADRRNQILAANPALTEFINDIDDERASQAFNNLSHSPESRGFNLRVDYASKLVEQKKRVINAITAAKDRGAIVPDNWEIDVELWFESFRKKLKQLFDAYIYSLSACASAFITGPSNFPVARQQKRSLAADKKSESISLFTTQSPTASCVTSSLLVMVALYNQMRLTPLSYYRRHYQSVRRCRRK